MVAWTRLKNCYHVSVSPAPLPQRVPRAPGARRADGEPKPGPELGEEKVFEIPKDFPYKKVGNEDAILELDPLTSKVLEDELQNILIKIWQDLPDSPPTEAERVVADGWRNEAGDDLRNILGLNVTKRLLNSFNPLMVKVEFSEKPGGDSFRAFLKWLGCVAMKRVVAHTYVAQLRRAADLDRVCARAQGNVRIRELKAKITPYYNFIQCPPNIRTVYKEPEQNTPLNQSTGSDSEADKIGKQDKTKQEDKTPNVDLPTVTKKTNEEVKKTENKPAATKVAQVVKPSEPQHVFKKPEVPKLAKTPTKVEQKKVTNVIKTVEAKTDGKPENPTKTVVTKTPPATAQTFVAKKVVPKTEAPKKVPESTNTIKKDAPKAILPATKLPATKLSKPVKRPIAKTSPKNKVSPIKSAKQKTRPESDFDELDDEDILALMSNAVVLDECSGSDDEA